MSKLCLLSSNAICASLECHSLLTKKSHIFILVSSRQLLNFTLCYQDITQRSASSFRQSVSVSSFHSLPLITHHYFHNSCKPFNTQLLLKKGRTALIGTLMLMTIPSALTCRILDCALVWGVFFIESC